MRMRKRVLWLLLDVCLRCNVNLIVLRVDGD